MTTQSNNTLRPTDGEINCISEQEVVRYNRFKWGIFALLLLLPLLLWLLGALGNGLITINAAHDSQEELLIKVLAELEDGNVVHTTPGAPGAENGGIVIHNEHKLESAIDAELLELLASKMNQEIQVNVVLTGTHLLIAPTSTEEPEVSITPETTVVTVTKEVVVTRLVTVIPPVTPRVTRRPVVDPTRPSGSACTRINFELGADQLTGVRGSGTFIIREAGGSEIGRWRGSNGQLDSGWLESLPLTADRVWVEVFFQPDRGETVEMVIVNPAGGTDYGWMKRGICHSLEVEYP